MTKSNKTMTRLKRLLILAGILILLIFLLRVYGHKDQELTGVRMPWPARSAAGPAA